MTANNPPPDQALGLYIHWPFCVSKCPYCDFNSHVDDRVEREAWHRAYLSELERLHGLTAGRKISTVFFGGGTPSLMPPGLVGDIIEKVSRLWGLDDDLEVTLEANPTTAEAGRFRDFAGAGVNRLSIGVQSFDESALKFLGRAHGVKEAESAIGLASEIFPRFAFDLIYGLPDQTAKAWEDQMVQALSFSPKHLSAYQLTIEPGTAFYKERVSEVEPDLGADLYELTNATLSQAGLPAYEISNHAAPGDECRHNLIYWRGQDYLGMGPGAHGRLTTPKGVVATQEIPKPTPWLKRVQDGTVSSLFSAPIPNQDRAMELVLMGLRIKEGIDLQRVHNQVGLNLLEFVDKEGLDLLLDQGMVTLDERSLRATEQGFPLLNALIAKLLDA